MSSAFYAARKLAIMGVMAVAIGACDTDRATVLEPFGEPSYNAKLQAISGGRNLPRGTIVASNAGATLTINLAGLESLTTGVYQVWLGTYTEADSTDGAFIKAAGALKITRTDTVFNAQGDPSDSLTVTNVPGTATSSFTNGGFNTGIQLVVTTASLGVAPTTKNLVLVTIEDNANATAPRTTGPRPLWRIGTIGNTTSGSLTFGTYHPKPSLRYVYGVAGRGTLSFRGDLIIGEDSLLSRPPVGYYYATHIVRRDTVTSAAIDTVSLGALTAPAPARTTSLRDADETNVPGVVTLVPPQFLVAAVRAQADTTAGLALTLRTTDRPFIGLSDIWVTLETKKGDENNASPSVVLVGTTPEPVGKR